MASCHSSKSEMMQPLCRGRLLWVGRAALQLELRAALQQRGERTHPLAKRRRVISQNERLR
jgi:hypothetical protein